MKRANRGGESVGPFGEKRRNQRHVWVCRDLGNGNQHDTYVWWFWRRDDAICQWHLHEIYQPQFARLSKPERWTYALLRRRYNWEEADDLAQHYVRMKQPKADQRGVSAR